MRCDEHGIELWATPFDPWAVEALLDHVDGFKIASYDLLRCELIQLCAATGKQLVISTGMATLDEIAMAVRSAEGTDLRLLHCVSGYPTPAEQANLAAIGTLREYFRIPVGWSDHTCMEPVVSRAVVHWRASDVEVHIDLDGAGREAGEHNWTPERLHTLIASLDSRLPSTDSSVHAAMQAPGAAAICDPSAERDTILDGDGLKRPMPVEQPDVLWRADPTDGLRPRLSQRAVLGSSR